MCILFSGDSSSIPASVSEAETATEPKTKTHVEWSPMCSFDTKKELDKYISSHDCFYLHSSNDSDNGRTMYYYCNKVPARCARKCPVKLKVFENNATASFGVSVTTFVHDHSSIKDTKKPVFPEEMKKEAFTLKTTFAMKPRLICKQLERTFKNETIPNIAQVRHILREKNAAEIPPTVT